MIYYTDGTSINPVDINAAVQVSFDIANDHLQLPLELIIDDIKFADLYLSWISPFVNEMWRIHKNTKTPAPPEELNRVLSLFRPAADDRQRDEFLTQYRDFLSDPATFGIGSPTYAAHLCKDIDQRMVGIAAHLRARVKAACLVANCEPHILFGAQWLGQFPMQDNDLLDVKDGTTFALVLSPMPPQGLIPRTLHNASNCSCEIKVTHGEREYTIQMPPHGILRAVFLDAECTQLASLKGNISCRDTCQALIQAGDDKGAQLFHISRFTGALPFPRSNHFLDACADERGGAIILTARTLCSTLGNEPYLEQRDGQPLPIRCFSSGSQWAWLYADGRLESNLPGREHMQGVVSVVEDAANGNGLLVYSGEGAIDMRQNADRPVSDEVFCEQMMRRFSHPESCETVETQLMRFSVTASGTREAVVK